MKIERKSKIKLRWPQGECKWLTTYIRKVVIYFLLRCVCVRVCAGLTDDVAGGLEGQLYNALVLVRSSQVEDREDVLPA